MSARAARAYGATQDHTGVSTSDPAQLIVMVYERLFDHLRAGKVGMVNGEYAIESFTKAHDLIQQGLLACLDRQAGGEIAESLSAVYEWALREIIEARTTKSPEKIENVISVLTPLYEGWLSLSPKEVITHASSEAQPPKGGVNETRLAAVNY